MVLMIHLRGGERRDYMANNVNPIMFTSVKPDGYCHV